MQVLIKGEVLVCQLLKGGSINNHILHNKINLVIEFFTDFAHPP